MTEGLIQPSKLITCILPDDGTDIDIMKLLHEQKNINRVESHACRGVHNLQESTGFSKKLPVPSLQRILSVIVSEDEADSIFDFIYDKARINRPGGGALVQSTLIGATLQNVNDNSVDESPLA